MLPPTPTPLGPGTPYVVVPEGVYSLWAGTDAAIHTWIQLGAFGQVIQLLALVLAAIAGVMIVYKFVGQFIRRDAEE